MKSIILFTILLIFITSCNRKLITHYNVPVDGKYFRISGSVYYNFVNVENSIAYVDVMLFTKGPDLYYSDTIPLLESKERLWSGKLVKIYAKNKQLFIKAPYMGLDSIIRIGDYRTTRIYINEKAFNFNKQFLERIPKLN